MPSAAGSTLIRSTSPWSDRGVCAVLATKPTLFMSARATQAPTAHPCFCEKMEAEKMRPVALRCFTYSP